MLVTAVITTYKREPAMLERALNSILNQTHKKLEIIVVDDSPSAYEFRDSVKELCSRFPSVIYVQHQENKGACAARNTALSMANGEFIGFLDDDDEWLPEKIEKQLLGFTTESVGLVYCDSFKINAKSGKITQTTPKILTGQVYNALLYENFIGSTSFPLLRTSALKEIGGFDINMPASQDYDVWLRIAQSFDVDYIDLPLVNYYIHEGEQITKNPHKKTDALEKIINKNLAGYKANPKALASISADLVLYYALSNDSKNAFVAWIKTVKNDPLNLSRNTHSLGQVIKAAFKLYRT